VMLPIGQVTSSTDAGLMGLGTGDGDASAADDDLVNQLLSGDDSDVADDDALAASLLDDADEPASADAPASSGDFGGLDIGAADFDTPSESGDAAAAEADDPVIDDGAMKPGTFS